MRMRILLLSMVLTDVARGNVVGTDMQNFNPITSGLDFVTVHSSETLEPGFINFGLFINQAYNSLPIFDSSDDQGRTKFSDSLLGADINVGIGLLPGLDVGVSFPQVLHQQVETDGYRGQFGDKGATEVRVNAKWRLWGKRSYGLALVGSVNTNRVKNNPFVGKNAGPTTNLEFAADTSIGPVALGINLGRRWRQPGERLDAEKLIEPMGDQWIGSAAASYLISPLDTKVIVEVFGSQPAVEETENSDRLASTAEALIGFKHDFTTSLAGHVGGGSELIHGRGSPDWRLYAGLNYSVGPTFAKPIEPTVVPAKSGLPPKNPFSGPTKPLEKIVIHDILFEFDSATLVLGGPDQTLSKLVHYLNLKPVFTRLVIEGHTDSIGSDAYNADLSKRRAQTIRRWLITRFSLDPAKIQAIGKGERDPIADNGNYQGRQLNRRVEFTIYRGAR